MLVISLHEIERGERSEAFQEAVRLSGGVPRRGGGAWRLQADGYGGARGLGGSGVGRGCFRVDAKTPADVF